MGSIQALALPSKGVASLQQMAADERTGGGEVRIDARGPTIHYINDLEKDPQYMRWPKSVKALLQPNWPGQMYYVRKNLMTLVLVFDPSSDDGLQMAAMAFQIMQQQMPIRVGIAPVVVNPAAAQSVSRPTEWTLEEHGIKEHMFQCAASGETGAVASTEASISEKVYRIYRFVRLKSDNMTALQFLLTLFSARHQQGGAPPSGPLDEAQLQQVFGEFIKEHLPDAEGDDGVEALFKAQLTAKRFKNAVASAEKYAREKGFLQLPLGVINGKILPGDQLQRQLMRALMGEQKLLQQLAVSGEIDDETNVEDFILTHHSALEHFHPDLAAASPTVASIDAALSMPTGAATTTAELSRQLLAKTPYFVSDTVNAEHAATVSMWLVTDLQTAEGVNFAREALHFIRQSPEHTRLALLSAQENTAQAVVPRALAAAAQLDLEEQKGAVFAAAVLELAHRNLSVPVAVVEHLADRLLPAEAAKSFKASMADEQQWSRFFGMQRKFCANVLKLQPEETALVTNGRVVRSAADVPLSSDDFFALSAAEHKLRASSVSEVMELHKEHSWAQIKAASPGAYSSIESFLSDQILMGSSVFFAPDEEKSDSSMRGAYMPPVFEKDTPLLQEITVHAGAEQGSAPLNIVAALDPLSRDAQRLAPVLLFLTKLFPVSVKLILYPPSSLGELPLKNFYRYVLPSSALIPGSDR